MNSHPKGNVLSLGKSLFKNLGYAVVVHIWDCLIMAALLLGNGKFEVDPVPLSFP